MQDQSAAGKDLVDALLVAIPVLLGWVPMPLQALFLRLALPLLLTGSPSAPPYSPGRCHCHFIIPTISWALRLAGLVLAPT